MKNKNLRIVPRLDVKGPNLVKGINLEGLRVLGTPDKFARFYYENHADELFFQDSVASLYDRNNLHGIVQACCKEIHIPICVGGGIRSNYDIKEILRVGADKVAINTAAIKNPSFLKQAVKEFGASTIVSSIEVINHGGGIYKVCYDCGREESNFDLFKWIDTVQDHGVGEIVVTSVDREGTGSGFDNQLLQDISNRISVPLIIHGGFGNLNQINDSLTVTTKIEGLAIASMLHYDIFDKLDSNKNTEEGNKSFLSENSFAQKHRNVSPTSIQEIKQYINLETLYNTRK